MVIENEERLLPDRIEGVPSPDEATHVIGHDKAMTGLINAYRSGRMHHAWLVCGPRGIGKASFAFAFAKYLLSHPNPDLAPDQFNPDELSASVCGQVAQGGHPDLLHLMRPWDENRKRFKTQLSVEEIRRTQHFYGLTAGAEGWRVTILDCADEMNRNAANALLKILEEPPKRSLFFVLCHSPGRLLPTIRSRCQTLPLSPLGPDQITDVLEQISYSAPDGDMKKAAQLADGSVRTAIKLLGGDVLASFETFEKLMERGASGQPEDWVAAHKISDDLSRKGNEEAFDLFCDLVMGWMGRQVRETARQLPLSHLAEMAEAWDKAGNSINTAQAFNLDKKQVVLSLFASLFAYNAIAKAG